MLDESVAAITRALEIQPDLPRARVRTATYLLEAGRPDDAVQWIQQAAQAQEVPADELATTLFFHGYTEGVERGNSAMGIRLFTAAKGLSDVSPAVLSQLNLFHALALFTPPNEFPSGEPDGRGVRRAPGGPGRGRRAVPAGPALRRSARDGRGAADLGHGSIPGDVRRDSRAGAARLSRPGGSPSAVWRQTDSDNGAAAVFRGAPLSSRSHDDVAEPTSHGVPAWRAEKPPT